jgi:N4-gp56 family major capsid protein
MEKTIPAGIGLTAPGVDLTNTISSYRGLTGGDTSSELRTKIWSELVTRDAREKNVFAKFIGGEGSGKPIVEKRDLSAGGSDRVVFTTVAPIRGQGVRGEDILKNSTDNLDFGTFAVEVDLVRHAVAWTQVLKLMRFTGKTIDQLSAEVMTEWMARTEQDHLQFNLRQSCLNSQTGSNVIDGYGTGQELAGNTTGHLLYSEGISTDIIQEAKQALIANGGEAMSMGGDADQEIPGYLFFAPDACLRPLRSDSDYLEAMTHADARGDSNKLFSGSYAKWDNNVIANHNVLIDTARGRQGSPLLPTLHLWAANGDVTAAAAAGVGPIGGTDGDYAANFRGAFLNIPGGGGVDSGLNDNGTYHILGIDTDGTHALYSYTEASISATFGTITLTRVANATVTAAFAAASPVTVKADGDNAFSQGATFVQANAVGTPIGYALAMGKDAMYYAKGSVFGEQIFHYDDFANSGNEAHLSAVGVQSVYGMATRNDTRGRVPGVQLVECVRQVPGLSLAQ